MNSVSLRSFREKYGRCLKANFTILTNAFAAISRISSFASTFVWAHGILASSIHITSVIVSCAFVNFWKKSRRFIHSHVLLLIDDLATCFFSKMIFLNLNSWTVRNIPKFKDRASWSRDVFQPMRRRPCVYQQTNQNIAPVIKNFQNNGRSRRTELKMSLQYSSRFHI